MIERKNGEFFAAIADLQERKLALIHYIAEFYNAGNRSELDGHCVYSASTNSPGCAIGQFLSPELARILDQFSAAGGHGINITGLIKYTKLYAMVPNWMREMGSEFLRACQIFHDTEHYWTESGLSEEGSENYYFIVFSINNKWYDLLDKTTTA